MVYYNIYANEICYYYCLLAMPNLHSSLNWWDDINKTIFLHSPGMKRMCVCRLMRNVLSRIIWFKTRKSLLIVSQHHHLLAAWTVLWFVFTNIYGLSMFPCKVIYCRRSFSRLSNIVHSSYYFFFFLLRTAFLKNSYVSIMIIKGIHAYYLLSCVNSRKCVGLCYG